ncbi:MAG TPA: DUF3750 domain-containing protein [Afipia sp.]
MALWIFLALVFGPIGISAGSYFLSGRAEANWQAADRSSAGVLPKAKDHPEALVRIFSARTVRWRGIVAVHSWIVFKEKGVPRYTRYDYTAWGDPIRADGFVADGRWFGQVPEIVFSVDGDGAADLIPKIRSAIESYKFRNYGDYRPWPGPNSNTFIAAIIDAIPEMQAVLPPTAIGKDFPYDGHWLSRTPSGTGFRATLGGYLGVTVGWLEGVEINFLGAVVGLDVRRPAIKIPGIGRIGVSAAA